MIKYNETLGNNVYDLIIKQIDKSKMSELCEWVKGALNISNSDTNTFDKLTNDVSKHTVAKCLIYVKHIVKIEIIESIIQILKQANIEDDSQPVRSKNKKHLDNINYDLVCLIATYLPVVDLLNVCYINRLWHNNIKKSALISKCKSFTKLRITSKVATNYCIAYSSQWPYNNLKELHILINAHELQESTVPEFKQTDTIEYLNSCIFCFSKPLPHLKAIRVWGTHRPIMEPNKKSWVIQNNNKSPLILTCVSCVYLYEAIWIPNTKCILFDSCILNNDIIENFIYNKYTQWICIQESELIGGLEPWLPESSSPSPTADINKYHPNITLTYTYTCYWNRIYLLLKSNNLYDKYVSHFNIIGHYSSINGDIRQLLKLLCNVTNPNEPKTIQILFEHDGKALKPEISDGPYFNYPQKDADIWDFILKHYKNICSDANIAKFEIGILRVNGDKKTGVCFDLKKFKNSKVQLYHYRLWNEVVYIEDRPHSPANWLKSCKQIRESMPIN